MGFIRLSVFLKNDFDNLTESFGITVQQSLARLL